MAIDSMQGAGLGGLDAFQKLRANAREKLTQPAAKPTPKSLSALDLFKWPSTESSAKASQAPKASAAEALQGAFAAAKADVLKTAVNYRRTGETDKAQNVPRLGQYVDLVA